MRQSEFFLMAGFWIALALVSCRERQELNPDPFADPELMLILEQPSETANQITEWVKASLTERGRDFMMVRAEELAALIDGRDVVQTPSLLIADSAHVDLRQWNLLRDIINKGVRIYLVGENPFSQVGMWRDDKWVSAPECFRDTDFPLEISNLDGMWKSQHDDLGGAAWTLQGKEISLDSSLGIFLSPDDGEDLQVELTDSDGNRWINSSERNSSVPLWLWDEFLLVDKLVEETAKLGAKESYQITVRFSEQRGNKPPSGNVSLLIAKGEAVLPARPFLGGISPGIQRTTLFDPLEFVTWTGSRVRAESGQTRVGAVPTFEGRSLNLDCPWRFINLLEVRRPDQAAKMTVAGILLRDETEVRNRVAWLSLRPEDLRVMRLETMWKEIFKDSQDNLNSSFVITQFASFAWTLQANQVPVFRLKYSYFADPDPEMFPRLDVEITPVGRSSPVYRSFTQRTISPGVVEIQMPSTISPGEFDVRVRPSVRVQSASFYGKLQVESRNLPRVERIDFLSGYVFRDSQAWFNSGLNYRPLYLANYLLPEGATWLSSAYYDPVRVEEELSALAQAGVDSIRIDVQRSNEAANLRDFLTRCIRMNIFVRLNIANLISGAADAEEFLRFVKDSRIDENRIAWFWDVLENPIFGPQDVRASLGRQWSRWVSDFYGSEEELFKLLEGDAASNWVKRMSGPSDKLLTSIGPGCPSILVYRAFLNDFSYAYSAEILRPVSAMRSFGVYGLRSGFMGSLNTAAFPTAPWSVDFASLNFQVLGVSWESFLVSPASLNQASLFISMASQYVREDGIIQFDGIGEDGSRARLVPGGEARHKVFEMLRELRTSHPKGMWWCGLAFDGYDARGRHRPGLFRVTGAARREWLLWRQKLALTAPVNISALRNRDADEDLQTPAVYLDPESDCRGPLGVVLRYLETLGDALPTNITLLNPSREELFAYVAGLSRGRLKNISANLARIRIIDGRGQMEPNFSRAGTTVSLTKGEVNVTFVFDNTGLADWPYLSRDDAINLRDVKTGRVLSRLDKTVRRGGRAELSFRASAEDLVAAGANRYSLYWGDRLITVTPEVRWTATRDWRE